MKRIPRPATPRYDSLPQSSQGGYAVPGPHPKVNVRHMGRATR